MVVAMGALCALCGALGLGAPSEWTDLLPALGGEGRSAVLTCPADEAWTAVTVAPAPGPAFDLEVELQWRRLGRTGGGFELTVGPHSIGSEGYRVAAAQGTWGVIDSRGPKLDRWKWHRLTLHVRPDSLAWHVGDVQIVRSPAVHGPNRTVDLRVRAGAEVTVRACRLKALAPDAVGRFERADVRFDYPPELFPHNGWTASGDRAPALGLTGAGKAAWLVSGQDAALPWSGEYEARFRIGGVSHAGMVWLEVARSGGVAAARKILRLEELPRDGYRWVTVPFRYEAGWLMEYRIAAETGKLLVSTLAVTPSRAGDRVGRTTRFRGARALDKVWGKARPKGEAPVRVVQMQRVLEANGQYTFRAEWRLDGNKAIDDVGLDLWVATRSDGGIVRVFEHSAAYDGVMPGVHRTAARFDPVRLGRYGTPVAFLAQVYWQGSPVVAGWRKWGAPVDDKYILEAERTDQLDPVPANPHAR